MSNLVYPALPGLKINIKRRPIFKTKIQEAHSGKEMRASFWSYPRYKYTLSYEALWTAVGKEHLQTLAGFIGRHAGAFESFLFTDPEDSTVTDHGFGVGNATATAFQLQRTMGGYYTNALGTWPTYTKPRTNRIPYSGDLSQAAWTKINGGTGVAPVVTANYAIAPDGTPTADRVVCVNGAGTTGSDYSVVKVADVVGAKMPTQSTTRSIWLKSNTGANIAASLGSNGNASAITITPTWQRFTYTYSHPTLTLTHTVDLGLVGSVAGNSNATADFLAWGGQLEDGTTATDYIPTPGASAVTVTPAYYPSTGDGFEPITELNGAPTIYRTDWQGRQQLYATARTNGAAYSEDYTNAVWVKNSCTITPNTSVAPDGNTTADTWTASATSGVNMLQSLGSLAPGTYTVSRYVKAGTSPSVHIGLYNNTDLAFVVLGQFTFATGAMAIVSGSGSYSVTPLSNGWWRISVTGTLTATKTCHQYLYGRSSGAGNTIGDTVLIWGDMQELGSAPTPYIPTTSTAVTITDYTVSAAGVVTFTVVPVSGAVLSWSGTYYRRVRFASDEVDAQRIFDKIWEAQTVELVSVK